MSTSWFVTEQRLRQTSGVELGVGATAEELHEAERALGITFPDPLRLFLSSCGWAAIGPRELFGLGQDVPAFLNLRAITQSERDEANPALPVSLIPLSNDGAGNLFCIRADATPLESPVLFWNHELPPSQIPEQVAENYFEWLDETVDSAEE